jgi:transcriptional regulator with XRE-family HTH domain
MVPVQCLLARTALGWGVRDLARAAEVSPDTVRRFERGGAVKASTTQAIQSALKAAGIIFIDADDGGPGVRLRKGRNARDWQVQVRRVVICKLPHAIGAHVAQRHRLH